MVCFHEVLLVRVYRDWPVVFGGAAMGKRKAMLRGTRPLWNEIMYVRYIIDRMRRASSLNCN